MSNKYQIEQEVYLRKLGIVAGGTIDLIQVGENWQHYEIPRWDQLYPGWKEKPIYHIKLNEPTRPMTYKEFCDASGYKQSYEHYLRSVAPINDIFAPEDDLITLDEIVSDL
jgi:hypothetical protein